MMQEIFSKPDTGQAPQKSLFEVSVKTMSILSASKEPRAADAGEQVKKRSSHTAASEPQASNAQALNVVNKTLLRFKSRVIDSTAPKGGSEAAVPSDMESPATLAPSTALSQHTTLIPPNVGDLEKHLAERAKKLPIMERKTFVYHFAKRVLDMTNDDYRQLKQELQDIVEGKRPLPGTFKNRDKNESTEQFIQKTWGRFLEAGLLDKPTLRKLDKALIARLNVQEPHLLSLIPNIGEDGRRELRDLQCLGYSAGELCRLAWIAQRMNG